MTLAFDTVSLSESSMTIIGLVLVTSSTNKSLDGSQLDELSLFENLFLGLKKNADCDSFAPLIAEMNVIA